MWPQKKLKSSLYAGLGLTHVAFNTGQAHYKPKRRILALKKVVHGFQDMSACSSCDEKDKHSLNLTQMPVQATRFDIQQWRFHVEHMMAYRSFQVTTVVKRALHVFKRFLVCQY